MMPMIRSLLPLCASRAWASSVFETALPMMSTPPVSNACVACGPAGIPTMFTFNPFFSKMPLLTPAYSGNDNVVPGYDCTFSSSSAAAAADPATAANPRTEMRTHRAAHVLTVSDHILDPLKVVTADNRQDERARFRHDAAQA